MNRRDTRNHLLLHPSGDPVDPPPAPPPNDDLDSLLRAWHQDNVQRAAAGRDRLLAALQAAPTTPPEPESSRWSITVRRISLRALVPLAAAAAVALVLVPFLRTGPTTAPIMSPGLSVALAKAGPTIVMAPDAGLLEAFDERGDSLGPCILKHTDVQATVSGPFTRVTLTQKYHNPHEDKIEAVYTFPLSNRAAVDRMTMTLGDRVIVGEVMERTQSRAVYEAARESDRTASLLEQERPNIFMQSVANIDPGADVDIEISYVEQVSSKNGEFEFVFPTVVGPRYIPGDSQSSPGPGAASAQTDSTSIPAGYRPRGGLVLLGPAEVHATGWKDDAARSAFDPSMMAQALAAALPIESLPPASADVHRNELTPATNPALYQFEVVYADGVRERGSVDATGVGDIGGRRFSMPLPLPAPGAPFASATDQAPDAHRITPMPTRPPTRSGHDVSIRVTIDTGGPGLTDVEAPLHQVKRQDTTLRHDGLASRCTVTLANTATIPNRDFVLKWRQAAMHIADAVFTSRTEQGDFFALMLQPPNRVEPEMAIPRELIFVLDTSGSMSGQPIEQSKRVARSMIDTMRPQDTLNVITFGGDTRVLWPEPRPGTDANRAEALAFFDGDRGGAGTEMMQAIETALAPTPRAGSSPPADTLTVDALSVTPADGREVTVRIRDDDLDSSGLTTDSFLTDGRIIFNSDGDTPATARIENLKLPRTYLRQASEHLGDEKELALIVRGHWNTVKDERVLIVTSTVLAEAPPIRPVRIAVFLTNGQVGNDLAIIDAVTRHRQSTRVFAFGVGNSVNRFLLDSMARAGNGAAEYVLLDAAEGELAAERAAARLTELSRTPVLTGITAEFSPGLSFTDFEPALDAIPDLFDAQPVTLLGRFTQPGDGEVTLRGMTAAGPWERTIPIRLATPNEPRTEDPRIVSNLWARARIDSLLAGHLAELQQDRTPPDVRAMVVGIGESFSILSPFTSFVAVDHKRITIDGQSRLVPIPIELPDRTEWDGFFDAAIPDLARATPSERPAKPAEAAAKKSEETALEAAATGTARSGRGSPSGTRNGPEAASPAAAPRAGGPAKSTASYDDALRAPVPEASRANFQAPSPDWSGLGAQKLGGVAASRSDAEGANKRLRDSRTFEKSRDSTGAPADAAAIKEFRSEPPLAQDEAAERFFDHVTQQVDATEARGEAPPNRLAAAAAVNYIAQNARAGQYKAASRASELFQSRFPDDPMLNEAATLVSNVGETEKQSGAKEDKDTATPPPTGARAPSAVQPESTRPSPGASGAGPVQSGESDAAAKPKADSAAGETPLKDLESLAIRAEQVAERERLLARRLDPRLYELLPGPASSQRLAPGRNQQLAQNALSFGRERSGRQLAQSGPDLLVSVLVESLDAPTVEALQSCGLRIESKIDEALTVVGRVPLSKLVALALCQGVRRIEPVME